MTGKDLFEGISWVDERFVDEAEHAALPKPGVIPWIKIASMAACLCLILFALHNLSPYLKQEVTDGQDIADSVGQDSREDELKDDAQNSIIVSPGDDPTGEIPNVILYVEEMTVEGFIATVTDYGETDRLGLGTRLNVVIAEGSRSEVADGNHTASDDSKIDYTGCYVVVNLFEFDEAAGTIVVDTFSIVEKEG